MHVATLRRMSVAIGVVAILTALLGWALIAAPAGASAGFDSALTAAESAESTAAATNEPAPYTVAAAPKSVTPIAAKSTKRITKAPGTRTAATSETRTSTTTTTSSELTKARSILASYISRYPILKGTTVSFGDARGYQAVCYYYSGRIVISKSHTASLDRIIRHEIWHVVDWRDNGRIDWGERVPPSNASSYQ